MSEWDTQFGRDPATESEEYADDVTSNVLVIGSRDVVEKDDSTVVAKAHYIGADSVTPSNAKRTDDIAGTHSVFEKKGALQPPYNPHTLVKLFEHSGALRPNIDAYCVNIEGFGHRFEPVIDLDKEEAFEEVRTSMFFERLAEMEDGTEDGDPGSSIEVTDEEVEEQIESIRHEMKLEKAKLDAFFRFATIDHSFIALRKITRQDLESQGNGYWEVLRNGKGEIAQFNHVHAFTMRLTPAEKEQIEVEVKVKRTPYTYETITVHRRFRKYVQIFEGRKSYFKEFGDVRVISAKTGRAFKTVDQMHATEGEEDSTEATEIIHFAIPSLRSPYGIPRWVGNMLAVVGSRQAEEVNFMYFENKSVPPLAITVSGGRLSQQSHKKLEDFIENRIKGKKNFHQVLIIEGIPSEGNRALDSAATGRMVIDIKPLTDAQQKDSLFSTYDERNIDKIGMSFRLPRMLRGDVRDFNRATADAALAYAEAQVFGPERNEFDWLINRKVLPQIGIRFWTFASNGPNTRDPVDLADIIVNMVTASILTPEEGRELASAIFNRDFAKIEEIWVKIPPELFKAGLVSEGEEDEGLDAEEDDEVDEEEVEESEEGETKDKKSGRPPLKKKKPGKGRYAKGQAKRLRNTVRDLMYIRDRLISEEKLEAAKAFEATREEVPPADLEVLRMTPDEFEERLNKGE